MEKVDGADEGSTTVVSTSNADDSVEEAALTAGFDGTDITPIPAEEATKPDTKEPTTTDQGTEAKPGPETTQQGPKVLTEETLNAALAAMDNKYKGSLDKAFGTIGEIRQKIADLDAARAKFVSLSPKARERLADQFPEMLPILFDEEDVAGAGPSGSAVTTVTEEKKPAGEAAASQADEKKPTEATTATVDAQSNALTPEQMVERRLLRRDHPTWETDVVTPQFIAWVQTQPLAKQEQIRTSWDADFISKTLTEFKDAQKKRTQSKTNRLEDAVTERGMPHSGAGSTDDEEDAMVAAYNRR